MTGMSFALSFLRFLAVGLVLLVLGVSDSATGQDPVPRDGLAARFQLAEAYMRAGQFERAVALFEDLYRRQPESVALYEKLRDAYVSLKRFDDAIGLVDEREQSAGPLPQLIAERASLLYQKGDEEAAFGEWDRALTLYPSNENAYRAVYFLMTENRLFDRAIEVLERGRNVLGDEALFRIDLSYLYGVLGRHDMAMQEYVGLLEQNPAQLAFVKRRLARYAGQESMAVGSLVVVERAVRRDPLNRAFRELAAWLYMEQGAYRRALDTYRAIDRLEDEEGMVLQVFAREAANAEAFDVARDACEEILARYPHSQAASGALFALAELHEKQAQVDLERVFSADGTRTGAPHYEAALETYGRFVEQYPNDPRFPEALQRLGALQQRIFLDLDAAETVLNEVRSRFGATAAAFLARFNLGQIAIQRGDLTEARLILSRLEEDLQIGELAERARYEIALIDTYTGRFETALAIVSALDANTSTDIANDAIGMKVLLRENKGPDSLNTPLHLYTTAKLRQRQVLMPEALDLIDSLLSAYPGHALADEANFERGVVLRDLGRFEEALTLFLGFRDQFPMSYLVDRSLFLAAETMDRDLRDTAGALETYQTLLADFPGSMLGPQVRARIRRLRGDGV